MDFATFQMRFQRRDIGGHGLVEQDTLIRIHALGACGKLHATQTGDLVIEFGDGLFAQMNGLIALGDQCIALHDLGVTLGNRIEVVGDGGIALLDLGITPGNGCIALCNEFELRAHQGAQRFDIGHRIETNLVHGCTISPLLRPRKCRKSC